MSFFIDFIDYSVSLNRNAQKYYKVDSPINYHFAYPEF